MLITMVALAILAFAPERPEPPQPPGPTSLFNLHWVGPGSTSSPEILLASGAFGAGNNPADDETSLSGLALESGCGFLPLRTLTENYFTHDAASGYSRKHFYRDAIHANHRGKQLLGRILLAFLSGRPEGP